MAILFGLQADFRGPHLALRRSVERGTPFGSEHWVVKTATELGLQSTLRPRGRPRKKTSETALK